MKIQHFILWNKIPHSLPSNFYHIFAILDRVKALNDATVCDCQLGGQPERPSSDEIFWLPIETVSYKNFTISIRGYSPHFAVWNRVLWHISHRTTSGCFYTVQTMSKLTQQELSCSNQTERHNICEFGVAYYLKLKPSLMRTSNCHYYCVDFFLFRNETRILRYRLLSFKFRHRANQWANKTQQERIQTAKY